MTQSFFTRAWASVAAVILMAAGTAAHAEVINNYTESFSGLNTAYNKFAPRGWKHALSSEWYANTFIAHGDGGHTSGWLEAKKPSSTYYYDGFITPKVTGDCAIWVKLTETNGSLQIFTSNDGSSIGYSSTAVPYSGTVNGKDALTVGEWKQVTLPGVPANTYLAIVPLNCGICDFTAAQADVNYVNSLSLDMSKNVTTPLEANSQNQVTMDVKLKFTNTGDFDVAENTPGFNVSVVNTHTGTQFATVPITEAIPRGAVVEINKLITGPATLAEGTTSNNFKFTESLTGAYTSAYFSITPFAPVYNFVLAENGTHSLTGRISFGMTDAAKERTFYIYNSGSDELDVTGISVTGDFEIVGTNHGTVAAKANFPVTIRFKGTATGTATGQLSIATDKLGSYTYTLEALKRDTSKYFESFEGATLPAGYIFDSNWRLENNNADFQSEGNMQWVSQSYSTAQAMVMPLLQFAEGETLHLFANKSDNTSGNIDVQVSEDRVNWTSVYKIGASSTSSGVNSYFENEPPSETGTGYGKYAFQLFSIPMTQGAKYVRFNAGGVRIHDIYGGQLVPVDHDMMFVKHASPASGMVNNPYSATVTLRNIGIEPEVDYTVALMVNNEVGATAEYVEYPGGSEITFPVVYYPHQTGTMDAFYRFTSGDFTLDTPAFTFNVVEETSVMTVQAGEKLISQNGIVNPYYKNSATQVIYTPAKLGITAGSVITGMHSCGYMTRNIAGTLRVWMQNTTEENFYKSGNGGYSDPVANVADPDEMTLVFEGEMTQNPAGTASQIAAMEDIFPVIFDNNFTYTGGNILMMVELNRTSPTDVNFFSAFDNSTNPDAKFISFSTDSDLDDLDLVWRWNINTYGVPVTFFDVQKDSAVVNGTVTAEADGTPIADATVLFENGPVRYQTMTAADGTYSMPIYQADGVYAATVSAENYVTHNSDGHTFLVTAPNEKNFTLALDLSDGISDTVIAADETFDVFNAAGVRIMENVTKAELNRLDNGIYVIRTARATFKLRK